jgi:hypothetical protein
MALDTGYTWVMAMVKQTAFRFNEEDLALLDAVQRHTGISTRTDALRAVLRSYVRAEGIGVAKPRTKSGRPGRR